MWAHHMTITYWLPYGYPYAYRWTYVHRHTHTNIHICAHPHVYAAIPSTHCICASIRLCFNSSVHLFSIHPSIPPSILPSVRPSVRPSIHPSIRPFCTRCLPSHTHIVRNVGIAGTLEFEWREIKEKFAYQLVSYHHKWEDEKCLIVRGTFQLRILRIF